MIFNFVICFQSDPLVEKVAAFFVVVGLIFLTLAVLTFALCRRNPRVTNVARLNLSVTLLLAHALFFITQTAIKVNQPPKVLTLCSSETYMI